MSDFTVKVPRQVAEYAQQLAKQEFLKPSEVVRSLMTRGMFADQMQRSRGKVT